MGIKTLLEEEIRSEIEMLGKHGPASAEYKALVDGVTKLTEQYNNLEKTNNDKYDKEDARYNEMRVKDAELAMERKDRLVKNWLTGVSIGGGFVMTAVGAWATFKFEETGTVTSILGRGFINRFLPKK